MTDSRSDQVLVVGAGPVGLVTAHELARRGVAVRVVDAAEGPSATSRAIATHARTLEIYDQMGVVEGVLARGRELRAFTMHRGGRQLVRMGADYSRLPTRYPFTLMIPQAATEEVLREALARRGVKVEWGVRLEEFTHSDEGVRAVLRHDGPQAAAETVAVDWMVGCDGGHSLVRKNLGFPLIGDASETWLIADAEVETEARPDSIHWISVGGGTVMLVPFPEEGRWRLLDTADAAYRGDPEEVARRFAAKLSAGLGTPVTVRTPDWVSVFTIQQRMVPSMRAGRVLVAGDAAHVHSPASGQGMNTGVQDAFNLAWKLAMVVRGEADAALLDSYPAERVPVGEKLLGSTARATALVALKGRLQDLLLPVVMGVVRRTKPLKGKIERKIMAAMSALDLRYPDSPLTLADPAGGGHAPRPGQRVALVDGVRAAAPGWSAFLEELRDPRWTLLVAGAPADQVAEGCGAWLSVREVADAVAVAGGLADPGRALRDALGLSTGGWLLVRPDGYLAARGGDFSVAAFARAAGALGLPGAGGGVTPR
ncbi:FAD-dependent oxidoreductase [Streptomyces sp. NPDC058301]|uniref:FAD-dependent oxidoreductase n=1 Tax=Streptomyces sp. NPDC058301 TaxID=3346436 RepID=UPI0036EA5236